MWKRDSKEESIGTNRGKGLLSSISYAHLDFESRWLDGTRLNAKGMKHGLQDSSFSLLRVRTLLLCLISYLRADWEFFFIL